MHSNTAVSAMDTCNLCMLIKSIKMFIKRKIRLWLASLAGHQWITSTGRRLEGKEDQSREDWNFKSQYKLISWEHFTPLQESEVIYCDWVAGSLLDTG